MIGRSNFFRFVIGHASLWQRSIHDVESKDFTFVTNVVLLVDSHGWHYCESVCIHFIKCSIHVDSRFLCFSDIVDFKGGIIYHTISNEGCYYSVLHHFPAIGVELDEEWEPFLEFDMHEVKMSVEEIQVKVFTFTGGGNELQELVVLFLWQRFGHSSTMEMVKIILLTQGCPEGEPKQLFLWNPMQREGISKVRHGLHKGFYMGSGLYSNLLGKSRKILQLDIVFRHEMSLAGRKKCRIYSLIIILLKKKKYYRLYPEMVLKIMIIESSFCMNTSRSIQFSKENIAQISVDK